MSLADDTGPCTQVFLKNMDTLLRCPICFDFLSIAMMSPCSHNFCSLCIRKFLSYKLQCPVCNSGMTQQDLRNNRIIDDVVKSFQDARKRLAVSSAVKRKAPTPPSPGWRGPVEEEDDDEDGSSALSLYFHSRRPNTSTTAATAATAAAGASAACVSGASAACVSGSKEGDVEVEVVEVRPPRGKRARGSCHRTLTFNASQQQKALDPNNFTSVHVKKEATECDVTDHDSEVLLPSQSPRQPKGPKKVGSVLTDFFLKQSSASSASSASPKPKGLQAQTPASHRTTPAPFGSPEAEEEEEEEAFQPTRSFKTRGHVKVKKEQPATPLDSASRTRRELKPRRGRPSTRTSSQHTTAPLSATESQTEASQAASTSTCVQVKEEKAEQDVFTPLCAGTLSGSTPVNKEAFRRVPLRKEPLMQVECPVCEVPIPVAHINSHLDFCLRGAEKKEALRSSGRRKPMTKVVYNLLSVAELKKRLKACELSTHGSKDQMVKRHQEFLLIYNAECDSLQPRSAKDIAKEVETNEKMRAQLEKTTKATMVFKKDQTEEEIEAVHSSYRKQHSSEFSRLVAQVKGRMRSSKTTRHIKEEAAEAEEEMSRQAVTSTAAVEACPSIGDTATVPAAAHDRPETPVVPAFQLDAMETCPTQRYTEAANEEMDTDQGLVSPERRLRSPSPTPSEVSVSSSISDVFS